MYEPRRKIQLIDGREVSLVQMYRQEIYLGVLEGTPDTWDNDQRIHRLIAKGRELFGDTNGKPGMHILPFRVKQPPALEWLPRLRAVGRVSMDAEIGEIEWLPEIASIGLFRSTPTKGDAGSNVGSVLSVVWFQHDPFVVLEEEPLEWWRQIKWDELAEDYIP